MAGVLTRRTVDKTVELARKLQPNARRLFVISGEPGPREGGCGDGTRCIRRHAGGGTCVWITAAGIASTGGTKSQRTQSSAYCAQSRDREGRPYIPREILRALAAASPAPVYGTHETYLGTGIAAGVTESYTNRGRMAAQRLLQLAAGETIPVLSHVADFWRG